MYTCFVCKRENCLTVSEVTEARDMPENDVASALYFRPELNKQSE